MPTISKNQSVEFTDPSTGIIYTFHGITVVTLSATAKVTPYPVSGNVDVSNQMSFENQAFRMSGFLFDRWEGNALNSDRNEQLSDLKNIYNNGKIVRLKTSFGYFEKVIIASWSVGNSNKSENAYNVTIIVQEIRVAELEQVQYQLIVDAEGNIIGADPSDVGSLEQIELSEVEPNSEDSYSFADALWDATSIIVPPIGLSRWAITGEYVKAARWW